MGKEEEEETPLMKKRSAELHISQPFDLSKMNRRSFAKVNGRFIGRVTFNRAGIAFYSSRTGPGKRGLIRNLYYETWFAVARGERTLRVSNR